MYSKIDKNRQLNLFLFIIILYIIDENNQIN